MVGFLLSCWSAGAEATTVMEPSTHIVIVPLLKQWQRVEDKMQDEKGTVIQRFSIRRRVQFHIQMFLACKITSRGGFG